MPDEDYRIIERLLVLHDAQLEAMPIYRPDGTWDKSKRAIADYHQLPLNAEDAEQIE
ncbi:hypothetical protein [Burkholderia ubonensis]|uniref:hypothetical protein n=1 Tax=Burkholderia ubonensis TaxID=101571 RepID=UPI000B2F1CB9|nr:hypothetical protein [Burkholderia ubonensis]